MPKRLTGVFICLNVFNDQKKKKKKKKERERERDRDRERQRETERDRERERENDFAFTCIVGSKRPQVHLSLAVCTSVSRALAVSLFCCFQTSVSSVSDSVSQLSDGLAEASSVGGTICTG